MKKNKLIFALKITVSAIFLVWIIFSTRWDEVFSYIREINFFYIIVYLLIIFAGFSISAYKWKLLANFKNIHLPFKDFFNLYLTGIFINNFFHYFIGGDAFRVYSTGEKGNKYSEATLTVIIDRITGFVGATILALLFSVINIKLILKNNFLIFLNFLLIISLMLDLLITEFKKVFFIKNILRKILPAKIFGFIKEIYSFNDKGIISKSVWLSILYSFIGVGMANYVLFFSLDIHINIFNFLAVIFLIQIISALPISFNNFGLKEWAYITLFGLIGVAPAASVTVVLIGRFTHILIGFFAIPIYLQREKIKHKC